METIKEAIMREEGITAQQANRIIAEAKREVYLLQLEGCFIEEDFMKEWFSYLHVDYITQLI
jgi:hypothetical protein